MAECVCEQGCPKEVDLVCGSDGITYNNECIMKQTACQINATITVRRKGDCGEYSSALISQSMNFGVAGWVRPSVRDLSLVCLSHVDPCKTKTCTTPYSSCEVRDDVAECVCEQGCPKEVDLVCGSDGITYNNECIMKQTACQTNTMITVRRGGDCGEYDALRPFSLEVFVYGKVVSHPSTNPARPGLPSELVCLPSLF